MLNLQDQNAMDTTPGRICIAEAEDFTPGSSRYQQRAGGRQEGGISRGPVPQNKARKVFACFNCRKTGHFKRDCHQPLQRNPYQYQQGPSHTRQGVTRDDNLYAASSIVDDHSVIKDRTPQQKAQDWLSGVAEENDDVKDLVMQELWKKEDFQST